MSTLAERIERVRKRVETAARGAGRDPGDVRIVAICKTFPPDRIVEAAGLGLDTFGENRVQEAAAKIPDVAARVEGLRWHLVGQLQRNKAARAIDLFSVIESVDRPALADALARAASARGRRVPVLIQVNVDREERKGGVAPEEAADLLDHVDRLPEIDPLGLMAIPAHRPDPEAGRPAFAALRRLRDELIRRRGSRRPLDVLSMGMSHDFEVAIQEGADWVRIGTAIFGERRRA